MIFRKTKHVYSVEEIPGCGPAWNLVEYSSNAELMQMQNLHHAFKDVWFWHF